MTNLEGRPDRMQDIFNFYNNTNEETKTFDEFKSYLGFTPETILYFDIFDLNVEPRIVTTWLLDNFVSHVLLSRNGVFVINGIPRSIAYILFEHQEDAVLFSLTFSSYRDSD